MLPSLFLEVVIATAVIGVLVVSAMVLIALRANDRLRSEEYLPMQWLVPDVVVSSAPRAFALALLPAVSFLTFTGLTILSVYERPRPGQEGLVVPALLFVGLILIAVQIFHLWMVHRTLDRNGR